jgi:hypothetical protein
MHNSILLKTLFFISIYSGVLDLVVTETIFKGFSLQVVKNVKYFSLLS